MTIQEIMTVPPTRIRQDSHLRHAAEIVALSGASDLMVVDQSGNFLGVLSEGDILRASLPDFAEIADQGGSPRDGFGVFLQKGRALSERPIMPFVIRDPLVLDPDDHVAEATGILVDRMIRRLPVVKNGKLVGTVSRADVCRAVVGTL